MYLGNADDSGIGRGSSTASRFANQGLYEKTGGTGTSTVSVSLSNSGTVAAASTSDNSTLGTWAWLAIIGVAIYATAKGGQ